MKIILILCVLIGTACCDLVAQKKACIESFYYKTKLASREDRQFCGNLFQNFTAEFTSDVMQRLTHREDQRCILEKFEEYKINDLYLRGLVSHLHNGTAQSAAYEDDVDESVDSLLKAVKVLCAGGAKLQENFEDGFKEAQSSDARSESVLCKQKYFIEKNIINPADYNVDTSTFASLSCNDEYKHLDEMLKPIEDSNQDQNTFFGLSAVKALECTARKFAEEKVLEKIFSFNVIVHLDMTQSQKDSLKEKYVGWGLAGVKFLLECVKEI